MLIYGQCPYCGSTDTRSVRTGVCAGDVPAAAWDERHCDACAHDYTDWWDLVGPDERAVYD